METPLEKSYRLVTFHDPERKAEIMQLDGSEYPKGWSSISLGYPTLEELKEHLAPEPCSVCGSPHQLSYANKAELMKHRMCFSCNFWRDITERAGNRSVRVKGCHYTIAGETGDPSSFRGFSGRRWRIKFHDGREVDTTNLWFQGNIPKAFQDKLPDNAEFLPTS